MRGATILPLSASSIILISIHAPRAGSDVILTVHRNGIWKFQSTLPVRGATGFGVQNAQNLWNFNPRSPCGERLARGLAISSTNAFQSTLPVRGATITDIVIEEATEIFQSTLPVRGATRNLIEPRHHRAISIHAPRAGSDVLCVKKH